MRKSMYLVLLLVTLLIASPLGDAKKMELFDRFQGEPGSESLEQIIEDLNNENASIRCVAAYNLGHIGNYTAIGPLTQALNDEDISVRESAAWGLQYIRGPRAVDALILALNDSNKDIGSLLQGISDI